MHRCRLPKLTQHDTLLKQKKNELRENAFAGFTESHWVTPDTLGQGHSY